jgi:S1-C subfamily serine protease
MAHSSDDLLTPTRKWLSRPGVRIRIALACVAVLAAGAWLAPRAAQTPTPLSAPQERAAPLLEEQVQLREAGRPFAVLQDVAARVRDFGVAIPAPQRALAPTRSDFSEPRGESSPTTGFGVFISDTYVLGHSMSIAGRPSAQLATSDGGSVEARVVAYEAATGLVLWETAPAGRPAVRLATEVSAPGALVVAVGTWMAIDRVVPTFITAASGDRYTIDAGGASVQPGMPLYNLQGELLAIVAHAGDDVVAFPAGEAGLRLIALAASGELPASIGVALQAIAEVLTPAFGERGVLVAAVAAGGPADEAGLQPGDVLLAVGEIQVDAIDAATSALTASAVGQSTALQIVRGGRALTIEVTPALAYDVAALARAGGDVTPGVEARALFPAPALDQAGIPAAARVISVNGRDVPSLAQARQALRPARNPAVVLVRDGDQQFFAAIEPAP